MTGNAKWSLERLVVRSDERGSLVALESGRDVPFAIERVYYSYGMTTGKERGFHAHQTLEQLAIAVAGSCTFLLDDGTRREDIRLASPDEGLLMGTMVWHEMRDFSPDCVLLMLASGPFDEAEYIRDYDEFRRCLGGEAA